jgi:hypothetical protein
MHNLLKSLFVVLTLGLAVSLNARADHPAYLHALSDLRLARAYVSSGDASNRGAHVIEQIDLAINDIRNASIDDGKALNDHPPVDATLDFRGRFRRALDLVGHAHHDVNQEEDNGFARGLKHHALEHIDKAHEILKNIVASW